MKNNIQFLAFYLPQFHPIEENDTWWGKGFTEWNNVTRAKPLFKGHYQPRFPTDLGYYDLRVPETREQQADLAKAYGVDGFVYYHYWFGNGKKVLERPLQEVINSKKPDFPFCLCWANETWKGIWFGSKDKKVLIEQAYPGREDYINHFNYLLPAFKDERYINVDGKCLFYVYMPTSIPDLHLFVKTFRECAINAGIGDLYLLASRCPEDWDPKQNGFDGMIGSEFVTLRYITAPLYESKSYYLDFIKRLKWKIFGQVDLDFERRNKPLIVEYEEACKYLLPLKKYDYDYYPCVVQDWDNTARAGTKSIILNNSTPALWKKHLTEACNYVSKNTAEKQIVFIKSWNEWAEGNYLEPDEKWGHQYLEVVKEVKEQFNGQ